MIWKVEFDERARKELRKLDPQAQANILSYLRTRIATHEDPRRFGDPLRKNMSGFWKYRIAPIELFAISAKMSSLSVFSASAIEKMYMNEPYSAIPLP